MFLNDFGDIISFEKLCDVGISVQVILIKYKLITVILNYNYVSNAFILNYKCEIRYNIGKSFKSVSSNHNYLNYIQFNNNNNNNNNKTNFLRVRIKYFS